MYYSVVRNIGWRARGGCVAGAWRARGVQRCCSIKCLCTSTQKHIIGIYIAVSKNLTSQYIVLYKAGIVTFINIGRKGFCYSFCFCLPNRLGLQVVLMQCRADARSKAVDNVTGYRDSKQERRVLVRGAVRFFELISIILPYQGSNDVPERTCLCQLQVSQ